MKTKFMSPFIMDGIKKELRYTTDIRKCLNCINFGLRQLGNGPFPCCCLYEDTLGVIIVQEYGSCELFVRKEKNETND